MPAISFDFVNGRIDDDQQELEEICDNLRVMARKVTDLEDQVG